MHGIAKFLFPMNFHVQFDKQNKGQHGGWAKKGRVHLIISLD